MSGQTEASVVCVRCGKEIEWWQAKYKWNKKGTKATEPQHVGYCPGDGRFQRSGPPECAWCGAPMKDLAADYGYYRVAHCTKCHHEIQYVPESNASLVEAEVPVQLEPEDFE